MIDLKVTTEEVGMLAKVYVKGDVKGTKEELTAELYSLICNLESNFPEIWRDALNARINEVFNDD